MTQWSEPDERPSPHGFGLSEADEKLLRGPVPSVAVAWVQHVLGNGARVVATAALEGGTSSAVHAVSVELASGSVRDFVLRRFVRADWLAEEPDVAVREAQALSMLGGAELPTPELVGADADGSVAGAPSVLMSRLPGRVVWDPADVEGFLRALAELLPVVHGLDLGRCAVLPEYAPYPLRMRRPPAWASVPEVWMRAIDLLEDPPSLVAASGGERRFIHRDYHPGNVLWQRGDVSGLIDWVNASIGSPWADVGHCRVNIASELGQDAADRFLELYRDASGRTDDYHPYWDISAAIGGLDQDADAAPSPADEKFLNAAVCRL
ncbi:MAG TPA: aminoglycoside phosphotransferase family protein [Solirubrobacteraceae bacterium]